MTLYKEQRVNKLAWSMLSLSIVIPLLIGLTNLPAIPLIWWIGNGSTTQPDAAQVIHLPLADQTLQFHGNLVAQSDGQQVTALALTITNLSSSDFIDLNRHALRVDYRDQHQRQTDLRWTWRFQGDHDQDHLLEAGEQVQLTVLLAGRLKPALGAQTPFALDITPPSGPVLTLQRTTPPQLATTTDLQ